MTQPGFPFEMQQTEAEQPAGTDRRRLVLAGGLAAVLALGGGYYLLGGSSDSADDAAIAAVVHTVSPAKGATAPAGKPVVALAKVPVPFKDDLGRDPFRALYVEPVSAPRADPADPTLAVPVPAPTDAVGTPAGPQLPLPLPVPTDAPLVPDAAPPTAEEHALVLRAVTTSGASLLARFTVDGKDVSVAPMGDFGPTGEVRLLALQQGPAGGQWTAVLQVGDGQPFDAVTGEQVSVR